MPPQRLLKCFPLLSRCDAARRSLSILVTVEMFNALNALSERESLFVVKPWVNKWLILAIIVSFSQHFLVM